MYTFDYYFSIFSKLQCDAEQQRDDANLELKSNGKSDLTKNLNFGVPGGLPCCDVAETCHSTDVIIMAGKGFHGISGDLSVTLFLRS